MDELKKTFIWQESIDLATSIVQLCEEFTDENNALVEHLSKTAVDIPSTIASDLLSKRTPSTDALVRCGIELELVRRIYPALDTDTVESKLSTVMHRIQNGSFGDAEPAESGADEAIAAPPEPEEVTEEEHPPVVDALTSAAEPTQSQEDDPVPSDIQVDPNSSVTSISINQDK